MNKAMQNTMVQVHEPGKLMGHLIFEASRPLSSEGDGLPIETGCAHVLITNLIGRKLGRGH